MARNDFALSYAHRWNRCVWVLAFVAMAMACNRSDVEAWLEQPPPVQNGPSLYEKSSFAGAQRALVGIAGGGSIAALSLLIYPDHAVLQSQSPRGPKNVDQYVYRAGRISGPVPVKLLGKGTLEDNLFPLSAVRLEVVPDLVRAAKAKVDMPEGKVTRVLLRRNLPESMDIQFRVFVTSQRRDAVINADKDGNIIN